MNAVSQAITFELTRKIANLAVLFRAEFPDGQVDLHPWLNDGQTQQQLDRCSIDLSFNFPGADNGLACDCVLLEIKFSESLLCPGCQLKEINAWGAMGQQQQWQYASEGQIFSGNLLPNEGAQARFIYLMSRIARLFKYLSRVTHSREFES